jgi:hypothetical protein
MASLTVIGSDGISVELGPQAMNSKGITRTRNGRSNGFFKAFVSL